MVLSHKGPLLSVKKAFDLLNDPRFIVWEAAYLFGGYDAVLAERYIVCDAVRGTLPIILLEQFPICNMETFLEGFTVLVLATCCFTNGL